MRILKSIAFRFFATLAVGCAIAFVAGWLYSSYGITVGLMDVLTFLAFIAAVIAVALPLKPREPK